MPQMKKFLRKCGKGGIMEMNKKQYNNIIKNTLKRVHTEDSLSAARAVFKNMGVALPGGDMKEVFETVKTNNYMGWKSCTMEEAQAAANNGTAAIGISDSKIVVLAATDAEEPIEPTAEVLAITNSTPAVAVAGLQYYSYGYGGTTCQGGGRTCSKRTYKRGNAVAYARKYANSTGPNYVNFGDPAFAAIYLAQYGVWTGMADCANFVSQCLVAGGLNMNDDWYFEQHMNTAVALPGVTDIYYRNKDGILVSYPISYYFSAPWSTANAQYKYFSNTANGYTSTNVVKVKSICGISDAVSHYNIRPGDLMYFSRDGGKTAYHATIISDVTNDDIKFCAHTKGRKDKELSLVLGDETVVIVMLNDKI